MSEIGYGAMRLTGPNVWGPPSDPEAARRLLRLAVELGVRFFDTANAYGPRTVNQLIGSALRPFATEVAAGTIVVGNKVGAGRGPDGSWTITGAPDTVRRQVVEALDDLGVQTSELTYLRLAGDTPGIDSEVPLEDSLGALVELREQGLIRRIGLSGASPEMLARARAMTPIAAVQNRYNLLDRSGVGVLADCEKHDITFVPYVPLAAGQLAGLDELTEIAGRLDVTAHQVALAWLLRRSPVMTVIPGTADPEHLRANVAAGGVAARLTDEDVARLTNLVDESTAELGRADRSTLANLDATAAAHRPTADADAGRS